MDGKRVTTVHVFEKMDNVAYDEDKDKGTEMDMVQSTEKQQPPRIDEPSTSNPSTSCRPEVCSAARARYPGPDLRGSPWNRKKSISLATFIILLIVWIIVYFTLRKFDLL